MGQISRGLSPTLQQLRPWHKSMVRMMVAGGKRPGELAQIFGMSPTQITIVTNSPLFIMERERLEAQADYQAVDVRGELEIRQGMALEVIDECFKSPNIKVKKDVAFEILDRTGFGKKAEVQKHAHLHLHREIKDMSDEDLAKEAMDLLKDGED